MFKTDITALLGIEYPCFQGAMAWVADADIAAAVSNAGGLGIIAAGSAPADWVRAQIRRAREKTDRIFGVNIMLMSPTAPDIAQLVIDEKIQVVTTGAGNPGKYMPMWKQAGIKVIPVIASVAQAKRMQRVGADAVVAEGCEAGGHIGELTTMTLVPQVVDAVDIPVVAAGGIADGRGIAAAFMLGAKGVQVGTRFLVAKECNVHDNFKDAVIECGDIGTIVTGRSTGHPVRVIKNQLARENLKLERETQDIEKIEEQLTGTLRLAVVEGDTKKGSLMAGQSAGMVTKRQTAEEIITEMFSQAEKLLAR
ncbi:MAG TPA: enoyl-[acyl-carrier-protein] reductase FabK [Ruminococcaceae bacterium]|nr:enoyl-[acyl-carrier-protein] reductase FabK [Oscillospiraceae bacterium]